MASDTGGSRNLPSSTHDTLLLLLITKFRQVVSLSLGFCPIMLATAVKQSEFSFPRVSIRFWGDNSHFICLDI